MCVMGVTCVCVFTVIIGASMLLALFCSDFQQSLKILNREIEQNVHAEKGKSPINRRRVEHKLCELIQFHADIRQLSAISLNLYRIQYYYSFIVDFFEL